MILEYVVNVCTVRDKQSVSYELSSDSDDDDDDEACKTVVAVSSPASGAEQIRDAVQVPRRHSADDRPITPMRNQMLYSMMLEAHEFDDGALLLTLFKGAITSKIKHAIKHNTSPARLAQLLQPSLASCFSLQPGLDGTPSLAASSNKMPIRAATVVQQLCKSCRTCVKFYCMFYFTCDRSLTAALNPVHTSDTDMMQLSS